MTDMHCPDTSIAVEGRLHVLGVAVHWESSDFLFRKTRYLNRNYLHGCGIQRTLSHYLVASQKPSPQSKPTLFPDRTERIRTTAVLPIHPEPVLLHPAFLCNTA